MPTRKFWISLALVSLSLLAFTSTAGARSMFIFGNWGIKVDPSNGAVTDQSGGLPPINVFGGAINADGTIAYLSGWTNSSYAAPGYNYEVGLSPSLALLNDANSLYTHTSLTDNETVGYAIAPDDRGWTLDHNPGHNFTNPVKSVDPVTRDYDPTRNATSNLPGKPNQIALSPDGNTAYVSDAVGKGSLYVMDLSTVPPTSSSTHIALNGCSGTPITCDAASGPIGGDNATSLGITPDGKYVYTVQPTGNHVSKVDTSTNLVVAQFTITGLSDSPQALAVRPDGREVYVVSEGSGTIVPIDVATDTVKTPIVLQDGTDNTGAPPTEPYTPDPYTITVSPDGKTVYALSELALAHGLGTGQLQLWTVDTATDTAGTLFQGSTYPEQALPMFIPNRGPAAAFTPTPGATSDGAAFDASASSDTDGTVASYDWDFGDGSVLTNGGATPTHAYAAADTYSVTLTVTDNENCSVGRIFTGQQTSCTGNPDAVVSHDVVVAKGADKPPAGGGGSTPPAGMTLKQLTGNPKSGKLMSVLGITAPGSVEITATAPNSALTTSAKKRKNFTFASATFAVPATPAADLSYAVKPSKSGKKAVKLARKNHRKLSVLVTVTYRPAAGSASSVTKKLKLIR